MGKEKALVYDIDDTIVPFVAHLCDISNKLNGTNYKPSDLTEWALPPDLMKTFEEYESWLYVCQPVFKKAKDKLKELSDKGYKIILMTARDEKFANHTKFNLAVHEIKYDHIFFNKNKSLKINRLSDKYEIIFFVDDKLDNANKVRRDTDIPFVYLINMPSNKGEDTEEGIIRINSICDIKEIK